jgi:galactitol-specific phosphotransferase system IIB component
MNISVKSLKYENNKMNEEIRRIDLYVPSKKIDGPLNSIDKMQYFVNLSIEFSSQVLKAVNENMESSKDAKNYSFLNLL